MDAIQAPPKKSLLDKALARWSAPRLAVWWAVAMATVTCAYFRSNMPFAAAATQYAMTRAIVEHGTFVTDDYQLPGTVFDSCDRAFFKGHYYSDKSPVMSFLGVPAFAVFRRINLALADPAMLEPSSNTKYGKLDRRVDYNLGVYFTTFFTSGLAAIAMTAMLVVLLLRRGVRPALAAAGGVLWLVATPIGGYSVFLYGYAVSCALIVGVHMLLLGHYDDPGLCRKRELFAAGLLMGLAAWTLNTIALGAMVMTVALLASALDGSPWTGRLRCMWGRAWPWGLGGAIGAAGYFMYVKHVFGSFASPYRYEQTELFRTGMSKGLMGAGWPKLNVLWLLTFHRFRGLFVWFPITLLALAGAAWAACRASTRRGIRVESLVGLAFFAGLLLYNSGYYMWWGGWAYAPRHLIPGLALLGLGLASYLTSGSRTLVRFLLFVGFFSAIFNLSAIAINPHANPCIDPTILLHPETIKPRDWTCPFMGLQWGYWLGGCSDRTLGEYLGFYGRSSLVPLYAFWVAGLELLYCLDRAFLRAKRKAEGAAGVSSGNGAASETKPRHGEA